MAHATNHSHRYLSPLHMNCVQLYGLQRDVKALWGGIIVPRASALSYEMEVLNPPRTRNTALICHILLLRWCSLLFRASVRTSCIHPFRPTTVPPHSILPLNPLPPRTHLRHPPPDFYFRIYNNSPLVAPIPFTPGADGPFPLRPQM
ncbi:hypothetical protein BDN70DRAFT_171777 [Pholiota conissans]|uniref:Uncharacterized protein n=1 Tax=Pholiota conissans TaxID=109636 RepID=A0A9P5YYX7_9AGAR|nr:hypothetical protein BDN70DRAFT_171777 [Pholiota conissans]